MVIAYPEQSSMESKGNDFWLGILTLDRTANIREAY